MTVLIRLSDKMARLETLILKTHEDPVNEPIVDTYKDIIGYCALELLYMVENEMGDGE